ncbi:Hydrolase-4 domain-containing protein [Mycena venus]|uniref:Hydrolase-4 domain-containing protein n=1 Tax=Mycena venus TaxID=2733690 RepID=A0A8H6X6K1_9AGAR|nr:Hydrolase-4 domain-containing protein [Mycena venus]
MINICLCLGFSRSALLLTTTMSFEKSALKIASARPGWNLDAWQYLPAAERRTQPLPIIVMAHGFGANKTMGLAHYAEAFAAAGYACIVFDYRRWGASDGTPRHVLIVKDQLEDYRTVIKYARQQPEFDPQRLVLWGSSFSGAHTITLSADATVNAIAAMAQCPYTGLSPPLPLDTAYLKIAGSALLDIIKQGLGLTPVYIPVVSEPKSVGALTTEGTKSGMLAICSKDIEYWNEISASSLLQIPSYQPRAKAASVNCPLLIVLPTEDNLCLPEGAVQISKTTEKCQLVSIPCGHFDLYHGMSHHTESITAQLEFLEKHVPV